MQGYHLAVDPASMLFGVLPESPLVHGDYSADPHSWDVVGLEVAGACPWVDHSPLELRMVVASVCHKVAGHNHLGLARATVDTVPFA